MASKSRKGPMHQPFEGKNRNGRFIKITQEMMDSPAWQDLSFRQQGLYLNLKSKYKPNTKDPADVIKRRDDISFPKGEIMKAYGNYRTFKADIEALHSHGFIRTVQSGRWPKFPTIYGLCAEWQEWKPSAPPTTKATTAAGKSNPPVKVLERMAPDPEAADAEKKIPPAASG